MQLGEWIKRYEEKTGDKFLLPKGFQLYFLPERGFAQFKIDFEGSILMIYQACGDAKFWRDVGELMCIMNNIDHISTICTVNIDAYIRIFGWKPYNVENVNGQKRYHCYDTLGRKVIATFKGIDEATGEPSYWVTQYLRDKAGD